MGPAEKRNDNALPAKALWRRFTHAAGSLLPESTAPSFNKQQEARGSSELRADTAVPSHADSHYCRRPPNSHMPPSRSSRAPRANKRPAETCIPLETRRSARSAIDAVRVSDSQWARIPGFSIFSRARKAISLPHRGHANIRKNNTSASIA